MNRLRTLSLVLAAVAAATLLFGSSGFTSTAADRDVSVTVAEDHDAYVGYQTTDEWNVTAGDTIELVGVTNRFSAGEIDIDVGDISTESGDVSITHSSTPSVPVGESGPVTGTVEQCSSGETDTVQVTLEIDGPGVSAEVAGSTASREFEVTCAPVGS